MAAHEQLLLSALLLPAVGAVLIAISGRRPNLREGVTLATAMALLACARDAKAVRQTSSVLMVLNTVSTIALS